ncbi:Superfamily II DNA and RNA helicase [Desulfonatronum thiosulfatophilum]|uniref:Superfamily II DNA and RNA helicase n=1 Tax=Desulfonatronum thiosulfatophilum TaxID=617002 RepID=A0A1G6DJY3_9BACT|nr:DEAD/DEAH box helicase [Desulfonatronum thiosulfatophilum]SDB45448.1 Superfamily II DNA and RNA helicase [Desulfonatronum thiosulfatophilum]
MNFDSFALDKRIMAGVSRAGYLVPTPIQEQAIPSLLEGRDVLGLAQTGTGKTAAFALPILQKLLNLDAPKRGPLRVLVLAPTRELALQIHENFVELGGETGLRSAAVFGGVGQTPQVKNLRQATIMVACPGRLLDLMNQGLADLSQVDTLVLDEADRMLDMGFAPDIRRIVSRLPRQRQTMLFSATMPEEIRKLTREYLQNPVEVKAETIGQEPAISQAFYPVPAHLKAQLLEELLRTTEHETMLIFTRTKHRAKSLAKKLENKGWAATFLQGNMSQNRRQEAMAGLRSGKYKIMVATDIASRGIDCLRISHVINFDIPDTTESYTHRIGRTGRAQQTGEALSLICRDDDEQVRAIERRFGGRIERRTLEGFDYNAPGQAEPERERVQHRPRTNRPTRGRAGASRGRAENRAG